MKKITGKQITAILREMGMGLYVGRNEIYNHLKVISRKNVNTAFETIPLEQRKPIVERFLSIADPEVYHK